MAVLAHIREQYRLSLGIYGRPRMTMELKEAGYYVGERRAGRLMKINGIKPVRTRRHKVTTDSHHRLGVQLGLQLRNKTPKRRVKAKLREGRLEAVNSNDVWALDFVHDQLATGRKIRVLTVVDTFSRFSPVFDPRFTYRGEDVVATLDRTCRSLGYPKTIRVDQGS